METWLIVWRWVLIAGILIFPQLLGILLYYSVRRATNGSTLVARRAGM